MKNRYILFLLISLILVSYPEAAHAQALFDSGTNFLNALMNLLTNTWARIIAIIAVVGLGILWMTGRLAWDSSFCYRRYYSRIWRPCDCGQHSRLTLRGWRLWSLKTIKI